jgi:hypothetical protein
MNVLTAYLIPPLLTPPLNQNSITTKVELSFHSQGLPTPRGIMYPDPLPCITSHNNDSLVRGMGGR